MKSKEIGSILKSSVNLIFIFPMHPDPKLILACVCIISPHGKQLYYKRYYTAEQVIISLQHTEPAGAEDPGAFATSELSGVYP